eukprot:TRINITY_DN18378_c0_g1_i1.p1 TRINITY_DN18378_c0_g1~~TRINITY_DN18378_c0_g1_i1.p1  ORF type:complete len:487 (+),score=101.71 TRINITY_DN18378_c0_g1_i1:63-1523(+)
MSLEQHSSLRQMPPSKQSKIQSNHMSIMLPPAKRLASTPKLKYGLSDATVRWNLEGSKSALSTTSKGESTVIPYMLDTRKSLGGTATDITPDGKSFKGSPGINVLRGKKLLGAAFTAALAPIKRLDDEDLLSNVEVLTGAPSTFRAQSFKLDPRASLASKRMSMARGVLPEDISAKALTGLRVKFPKDLMGVENIIRAHPALTWTPKYRRCFGRTAVVIDESPDDGTVQLLFSNPKAVAWYPADFPFEWTTREAEEAREAALLAKEAEKEKAIPKVAVGDDVFEIKDEDNIGIVTAVQDGSDEDFPMEGPVSVRWQGDDKDTPMYHRDLRKIAKKEIEERIAREDPENVIFRHYDEDDDGHWNIDELNKCLRETEQPTLPHSEYLSLCKTHGCDPAKGFLLADLRNLVSARDINRIYRTISGTKKEDSEPAADQSSTKSEHSMFAVDDLFTHRELTQATQSDNVSLIETNDEDKMIFWSSPKRWRS